MPTTSRNKGLDKHEVCRRLMVSLKKRYPALPKTELPVLETMLYGICLENQSAAAAQQCFSQVNSRFHDLNEVRVSSVYELAQIFDGLPDAELRAYRLRSVLQFVFEDTYSFDYDSRMRKTMEQAAKTLAKIKTLTPFVRAYTMQQALDSHVLPMDMMQLHVLQWIGLAEPGSTAEHCGDALKAFVRKPDGGQFCHLIRCLSQDPLLAGVWEDPPPDPEASVLDRLELALQSEGKRKSVKEGKSKKPEKAEKTEPAAAKKSAGKAADRTADKSADKPAEEHVAAKPSAKIVKSAPAKSSAVKEASAKAAVSKNGSAKPAGTAARKK